MSRSPKITSAPISLAVRYAARCSAAGVTPALSPVCAGWMRASHGAKRDAHPAHRLGDERVQRAGYPRPAAHRRGGRAEHAEPRARRWRGVREVQKRQPAVAQLKHDRRRLQAADHLGHGGRALRRDVQRADDVHLAAGVGAWML
eukprot:Unigene6008_Nuclearia_a/m.18409 Unigene6008_Nuclearia_a/g.18409  ORF Unigene6008_Nuclearia_a/g.18409 Unigene6008_Nuclearia_a/m.18409 type:complete len:145 (-) Unigene6008_Nuclearia_a:50-484(-)